MKGKSVKFQVYTEIYRTDFSALLIWFMHNSSLGLTLGQEKPRLILLMNNTFL